MNSEPTDLQIPAEPVSFCCGVQPVIEYVPLADNGNDCSDVRVVCRRCRRRGPDRKTEHEAAQAWNEMPHEQPYSDSRMWKVTAVVLVLGAIAIIALSLLTMHKVEARDGVRTEQR